MTITSKITMNVSDLQEKVSFLNQRRITWKSDITTRS